MKHLKIIVSAFMLAAVASLFGFAKLDDDDIIKKVATQLDKWSADSPQEKVYLHMDKPYYAIGDDIWFKAYVTVGAKHQPSAVSDILNVELINDQDSVKKAIKLPLISGLAEGDFKLTDTLKEGNYRIRAYTNWMRNNSDEYFFDKTIQIGNSISNTVFATTHYTYSNQNNQQKVDATVSYTDADGKPYADKEVNYEVHLDAKSTTKGKGVTDNAGSLSFSFLNNVPALLKSGRIVTHIKLDPKQTVTKVLPVKATSAKVDVQFFPESGYLVNGVRSRVAFKAVTADGLGADIKGMVVDNQNNEIARITTEHLGMGVFIFTPEAGKTYTAKITYPGGTEGVLNLPAATDKGYVLNVYNNSDDDDLLVKISVSQATLQENQNAEINLVAQSGGAILFAAKTKLQTNVFSTKIPKSRFPTGIVQFTLFSATGEPLNERIVFIQNADLLHLTLNTAQKTYGPREKVKLTIESKNKDNQPEVGAFSVAVIDESKVPVDESSESTILSNILLTSDIKGYVEKPNYYFTNVSDKTKADLDILMLTQGYRRFLWKQIMADNFPPLAFKPEKSLSISGRLETPGGKAIANGKVTLLTTSGAMFFLDTVSDAQGRFAFNNLIFTDSIRFAIQGRTEKDGKNVEIKIDNVAPQAISKNKNSADIEVNINSNMAAYLHNSNSQYQDFLKYGLVTRSTILNEVAITDKKKILKHSDNLNGAGNANQIIKADQLENCATLAECLTYMAHFVTFKNGMAYSTRSPGIAMGIVVDGINMQPNYLDQLNVGDVASVEVLRTPDYTSIYGSKGAGGVLVITTKRGSGEPVNVSIPNAPGTFYYTPLGYYSARQYYSPQYDDPKTNAKVADLRTTIFWKPNIITDKSGNASVQFFNADSKGTYRAVIEGIDNDGSIGRQVYRYKVE